MILIHEKIEERNQGYFWVFSTRPHLYTPCLLLVKINICDTSEDQNWLAGHVCILLGSQKRISVDLFSRNLALDLLRNTSHQHLHCGQNLNIKVAMFDREIWPNPDNYLEKPRKFLFDPTILIWGFKGTNPPPI